MNTENIYRISALILLLSALSISISYRHKAAKSGEVIDSKAEGGVILTLRSIFGLLGWLSAFVYLINPGWMAWAQLLSACLVPLGWRSHHGGLHPFGLLGVLQPGEERYSYGRHAPGAHTGHAWPLSVGKAPALHGGIPALYRLQHLISELVHLHHADNCLRDPDDSRAIRRTAPD